MEQLELARLIAWHAYLSDPKRNAKSAAKAACDAAEALLSEIEKRDRSAKPQRKDKGRP